MLNWEFSRKILFMKRVLVVMLALFQFFIATGQQADSVINKFSASIGGLDAFNKIKTAKMSGTVTSQQNKMPITIQIINGKAVRTDVEVMGQSIITSYKDGKGWKLNPFAGITTPTPTEGGELIEGRYQTMLANQLIDYKNRGHKVEYAGETELDGKKSYIIKLFVKDDNKLTTYYIDAKDYGLIKSVTSRELQGQEFDVETFYSDLKEVNGLKMYMRRVQKIEGQEFQDIKLEKVEFDVAIDEKIYDIPK